MAGQSKSGSPIPLGSLAVLALFVAGVFVPYLPLELTRPAPVRIAQEHYPGIQNIPARFWEDPFVATAAEPASAQSSGGVANLAASSFNLGRFRQDILRIDRASESVSSSPTASRCVSLMPVMIAGGPYGEYAEARRRTRYAVISALQNAMFTPLDEDHIGYVDIQPSATPTPTPAAVAVDEWTTDLPGDSSASATAGALLESSTTIPQAGRIRMRIPFEVYEGPRSKECEGGERLVVLWLDEDMYLGQPVAALASTVTQLTGTPKALHRVRLIGPGSSSTLKGMLDELTARAADVTTPPWSLQIPLEIFPWGATVPDRRLAIPAKAQLTSGSDVAVVRAIPDDGQLLDRLIPELKLRGLDLASERIAIIAEPETTYGQALITALEKAADASTNTLDSCEPWLRRRVHTFHYLRGLDGETARTAAVKQEKRETTKDISKAQREPESAAGLTQLDYVRRQVAAIGELNQTLESCNSAIGAVGVLGTDFYDKSLLLQALRNKMPGMLLFTTDLDARMADANQSKWTRNLVVVSGFGLKLRPELQRSAAPFRDTYATSAYISVLLAVNRLRQIRGDLDNSPSEISLDETRAWVNKALNPRVYEIGLQEIFDFGPLPVRNPDHKPCRLNALDGCVQRVEHGLLRGYETWMKRLFESREAPALTTTSETACGQFSLTACDTIGPPPSAFAPLTPRAAIFALLVCVGLGILAFGTSWFVRASFMEAWKRPPSRRVAVASAVVIGIGVALAAVDGTRGEPFRWAQGISAWPTLIVLFVAVGLMMFYLLRVWEAGDMARLRRDFYPTLEPVRLVALPKTIWSWHSHEQTEQESLRAERHADARDSGTIKRDVSSFRVLEYGELASARRSAGRIGLLCLSFVILAIALAYLWGFPNMPVRGPGMLHLYWLLMLAYLVLYAVLLFLVVDAVRLFSTFIRRLARADSDYPKTTIKYFADGRGLPYVLMNSYGRHWIDIQFIAQRSVTINRLVYYPFVALALLVIARSSIFDNWHTPPSLWVLFIVGAIYTTYCALGIRSSAERARGDAVEKMTTLLASDKSTGRFSPNELEGATALIEDVKNTQEGAFRPLLDQPFWKGALLPLTSFGGTELIQYLLIVG